MSIIKIRIVPLGKINPSILDRTKKELRKKFKSPVEIEKQTEIPKSAFNRFREQYVSEHLLECLDKSYEDIVIGIIEKDIYSGPLNFIFGQAQLRGRVAIVSLARLNPKFYRQPDNETLLNERIVKEVTHELGHVFGLEHCKDKTCVMSFSNTIKDVDTKTRDFCPMCELQLK